MPVQKPPLILRDLRLTQVTDPDVFDPTYQKRGFDGVARAPIPDRDSARRLKALIKNPVQLIGRSAHCQAGLEPLAMGPPELEGSHVTMPVRFLSTRGDALGDALLDQVRQMAAQNPVEMGRLFFAAPNSHLTQAEINLAIESHDLWLPHGSRVDAEGVVWISLKLVVYELTSNIPSGSAQDLIRRGRNGLWQSQTRTDGLRPALDAKRLQITALHVSMVGLMALIDREVAPGVVHLAARLLDAGRTSGAFYSQIEIYNLGDTPALITHIPVRFYRAPGLPPTMNLRSPFAHVRGIDLPHVLDRMSDEIKTIMALLSENTEETSLLISGGRLLVTPSEYDPEPTHARERLIDDARAVAMNNNHPKMVRGLEIPEEFKALTNGLDFIADRHRNTAVYFSRKLPDLNLIRALIAAGVRAFVFTKSNFTEDELNEFKDNRVIFLQTSQLVD